MTGNFTVLSDEDVKKMASLEEWQGIGRSIINGLEDWSTGTTSRSVFISEKQEAKIRELLKDE